MRNKLKPSPFSSRFKSAPPLAAAILTFGSMTWQANAALSLTILESSDTTFHFSIAGDFSGLTRPSSFNHHLYIVPIDSTGSPVATWRTQYDGRYITNAIGSIDGKQVKRVAILDQNNPNTYPGSASFRIAGSDPFTSSSVVDSPINYRFVTDNLDPTDIVRYDLRWGFETLADSFHVVPEPSSALLLGIGTLGFITRRRRPNHPSNHPS